MIPLLSHLNKRSDYVVDSPRYSRSQRMDIWQPARLHSPAPVLVFIPGGGWTWGSRKFQGYQLMSTLCDQGWICVSVGYRTAPQNRWPAPFEDVTSAWMWVIDNIHEYGGDVDRMAIAGASAGGHMASLLGLTNSFTPDAVVSMYAPYSWDSGRLDHILIDNYVERVVVGKSRRHRPDIYQDASPIHQVGAAVPPFQIVHGTADIITPFSGAKAFFNKVSLVSTGVCELYTVNGGQHGFDLLNQRQADDAIDAITGFLDFSVVGEVAA